MKYQDLFDFGRKAWHRYCKFLPKTAREYITSKYCQYRTHRFNRISEIMAGSIGTQAVNIRLNENKETANRSSNKSEDAISRDEQQRKNGLGDDPQTKINLAFGYLSGLVRWLAESDYKVMSYNDLAGPVRHGNEGDEFQRWIDGANQRNEKAVLLQYDVDARPDVTTALMKTHIEYGVPGNAMIFRKKIFDWKLRRDGVAEIDEAYVLDFATFESFQKAGGVIGYHCNAFERAGGNIERAIEIFHEDVTELRKHVDLKIFSMHGGFVASDGSCNANMKIEPYLSDLGLTWVHNGHSVYFHSNWSDGGACHPQYRHESSDPLDFLLSTGIGERTRLLFHPQNYYDMADVHFNYPVLEDQKWVQDARSRVEKGGFDGKAYWSERYNEGKRSIKNYKELFVIPAEERPVFVNGMSRSGTTLLVSMFDAHPDGAMAYESYPGYLYIPADEGVLTAEEYIYTYQTLMNYPDNEAFQLLDRAPLKNLRLFAAVSSWTGMTTQQTGELLRAYLSDLYRVADDKEALKIVAASARFKVREEGANFWGTKCQGNFDDYFELWPKARLIYIMRNGLDILASQMTKGAFNPVPETVGKNWRSQYKNFQHFQNKHPELHTTLVSYEELVSKPEETCRALCEAVDFEFHPQMIRQHEIKTTLAKNPRGQLSAERVQQPIDNSSVNRWKTILSQKDVDAFLKGCGGPDLFRERGLEWEF